LKRHFYIYLLLFVFPTIAQEPLKKHYGMKDGLPSEFVYTTIQDLDGYIWACTTNGVVKFDGYTFKLFNASNGLVNSDVWDLHLDKENRIWLESFDDLSYIKNDSLFVLPKPKEFRGNGISKHKFFDGKHLVFFESEKAQFLEIKGDSVIVGNKSSSHTIVEYTDINHYVAKYLNRKKHNHQFVTIENGEVVKEEYFSSWASGISFIYFSEKLKDNFYCITIDSVFIKSASKTKAYSTSEKMLLKNIETVRNFGDVFYIVADGEVHVKDLDFNDIPGLSFLKRKKINSFLQDAENNYWVSSSEGINYYLKGADKTRVYKAPQASDNLKSIIAIPEEGVFLSSEKGNIYKYEKDQPLEYTYFTGSPDLKTIVVNSKNDLYYTLDERRGVFKSKFKYTEDWIEKDEIKLTNYINDVAYSDDNFFHCSPKDFSFTSDNNFAIAHSNGVSLFKDNVILNVTSKRTYALNFLDNNLWLGTTKGVDVYDENLIKINQLLDSCFIKDISKDVNNNLWIVADGFGLWKYGNDKLEHISNTKHLTINKVFIDEQNVVWLSCLEGVMCVKEHQGIFEVKDFSSSDNISSRNIIDLYVDSNYVYALRPGGMTVSDKNYRVKSNEKPIIFEKIEVNGIAQEKRRFFHTDNNVEIFYKTISYSDLGNLEYQWQLEGLDDVWRSTNAPSVKFNLLPPGDYKFNVKTYDSEGQLLNKNNSISFKIRKPWYQTLPFYLSTLLLLIASWFFFSKRKVRAEQKKAKRAAEIQSEIYELKMKAVQTQMNPHFIFNALNSIQSFIYNKDPEVANDYLVDFSRLMRLILESSKKSSVSLDDEIELIRLYISLERMRFQNKFDFSIDMDVNLQTESLTIPPNLLQPFIENAINHGIAHKDTEAFLKIQFMREKAFLKCIIEDDGVGRKEAQKRKKSKHTSRAMGILRERQKLMQLTGSDEIDFKIVDLFDAEGSAAGTQVTLKIPLDTV